MRIRYLRDTNPLPYYAYRINKEARKLFQDNRRSLANLCREVRNLKGTVSTDYVSQVFTRTEYLSRSSGLCPSEAKNIFTRIYTRLYSHVNLNPTKKRKSN